MRGPLAFLCAGKGTSFSWQTRSFPRTMPLLQSDLGYVDPSNSRREVRFVGPVDTTGSTFFFDHHRTQREVPLPGYNVL